MGSINYERSEDEIGDSVVQQLSWTGREVNEVSAMDVDEQAELSQSVYQFDV